VEPATIRMLARSGRVRPAYRVHLLGDKGPPRWLVATKAVVAYRSPSEGYAKPNRRAVPAGYVSVPAFIAATGIPQATLFRRMEAKEIASVKLGWRRFIPQGELERVLDAKKPSD
jgi:hypothetical protein